MLLHPFPQQHSLPRQVAFDSEPVGHSFTWAQQVHLTAALALGQTSCSHTWLCLIPVLWPLFTHRAALPLIDQQPLSIQTVLSVLELFNVYEYMNEINEYCHCELLPALWSISDGFGFLVGFSKNKLCCYLKKEKRLIICLSLLTYDRLKQYKAINNQCFTSSTELIFVFYMLILNLMKAKR